MTRNQERSLAMAMILLIVVIVAMALGACTSATKHLRKSEWHKQQAIKKGATVKMDTITFHFKSPEIKFNTTIRPTWQTLSLSKDTLKYTDPKTGASVKTKADLKDTCPEDCIQTIYQEVECPPQDMKVDVPCETVQAGYTGWEVTILCIAVAAVALGIGYVIRSRKG